MEETQVIQEAKVTQEIAHPQEKQQIPSSPPEETQEQINWKRFRQEREKERKEKLESDRRASEKEAEAAALKAAMESLLSKPQQQQQQYQSNDEVEETEDQRIDKKVQAALKAERDRNEAERREREIKELPQKIKSQHPDFDHVCSQDNVDYLAYHHPELYRRFQNAPENIDTYSDLYKVMKRYVPNADSRKEQAKIEKNLGKPQSMSNAGATQTGDYAPHKLDDKRRQDNWERMQRTIKGL